MTPQRGRCMADMSHSCIHYFGLRRFSPRQSDRPFVRSIMLSMVDLCCLHLWCKLHQFNLLWNYCELICTICRHSEPVDFVPYHASSQQLPVCVAKCFHYPPNLVAYWWHWASSSACSTIWSVGCVRGSIAWSIGVSRYTCLQCHDSPRLTS